MLYFDNAATTYPKPFSVISNVDNGIINYGGNPGRSGHNMALKVSEKIYNTRNKIANFFNASSENVIFTANCTMSLNMAIKGILKAGDHVIVSCLEHNAVMRPIYNLYKQSIISYDIAKIYEFDDEKTVRSFENCITPNTKAIICMHASNVTGIILPIEKIGKLAKKHDLLFIVDAAQSAGVIPIDMKKYEIDILCMPGHKGLYGITGSGILIVRDGLSLNTIMEGGTGSQSNDLEQPLFFPDRMESGTLNVPGVFSIDAGIDFINRYGMEKIYHHEFILCEKLYKHLKKNDNFILYNNDYQFNHNSPIVSFNIRNMKSEEVTTQLNKLNCAVRGGLHCSPSAHEFYKTLDTGMVRFSPSIFTKDSEVNIFVKNIDFISKKRMN